MKTAPNARALNPVASAVYLHLNELRPNPRNPRAHGDEVKRLARTILRTTWGAPIIAQASTRRIIGGHGRLEAARLILAGMEVDGILRGGADHRFDRDAPEPGMVPVRLVDVSDAEADAMTLADNARALQGTDDAAALVAMATAAFERGAPTMEDIGLGVAELDALVKAAGDAVLAGASDGDAERHAESDGDEADIEPRGVDSAAADAAADSRPGMVYELGPHRLVCGDATDPKSWALLMGGERPPCMVTDPPYGMSYKGRVFGVDGLSNDGDGEFAEVLRLAMTCARDALSTDALAAVCFGTSRLDRYFGAFSGIGLNFHRILTIYKPNGQAYPWRGWILTSEVIGLWSVGGPAWPEAERHCHDVYTFDYSERPDREIDHPTVKPLSIIVDLVRKLSAPGAHVADPFAGSGTTLIACAESGRVARVIELAPRYCDVIRRRWTRFAREAGVDPGPGALDP